MEDGDWDSNKSKCDASDENGAERAELEAGAVGVGRPEIAAMMAEEEDFRDEFQKNSSG